MTRGGGRWAAAGTGLCAGALAGLVVVDLNLPSLVSWYGDRSYLVPAAAVLGALAWLTPLRKPVGLAVALLALLWSVVAFTPLTPWLAEGLVRRDRIEAADAVFVFASRIQEDGDPTSDAMSRLLKGIELVADGHAPRLVVSEVPPPAGSYAPLAREWLSAFAAPRRSGQRRAHPQHARRGGGGGPALPRARLERVLAVTSPTHTRRAAAALEKEGLVVFAVPAVETRFDLERLHWPGDRREAFAAIAHERVGLLVYRRRGWID